VLAADGEAYRDARTEQARRSGVADFGVLSTRDTAAFSTLTALVPILPLSSCCPTTRPTRFTSGVLVDAHRERPASCSHRVPATPSSFSNSGAGIVVGHDDPDALGVRPCAAS